MAKLSFFSFLVIISLFFAYSTGQNLAISLDYGTFQGSYSPEYNLTYWKKIPFAAPPVGQLRFRRPQPPLAVTNGTYDSDQDFDFCPQRTVRDPNFHLLFAYITG
jgi:carboxylesterase type B